jgi:hypothetical protein
VPLQMSGKLKSRPLGSENRERGMASQRDVLIADGWHLIRRWPVQSTYACDKITNLPYGIGVRSCFPMERLRVLLH